MTERYLVGLDLGTTHCALAYWAPGAVAPEVLPLRQLVAERAVAAAPLLPSALYAPVEGEVAADPYPAPPFVVGRHAERRAREVPGRGVVSSKSWLAHAAVDREAPLLPWGVEGEGPRLSPVDAAARLLHHVRRCWDERFEQHPLRDQELVLTVPASFDPVARELTLRAARAEGLVPRLLEEPQAAFHAWLAQAEPAALAALFEQQEPRRVLVCDVGGGTTDLSLLELRGTAVRPEVERIAVGRHLLLGGDNLDLALTQLAEGRLTPAGAPLDAPRLAALTLACREAKERLLGPAPPAELRVTVAEPGSRLVARTRSARLEQREVRELLLGAYFPLVDRGTPPSARRSGLVGLGLPYEREPAITRHVVDFLSRHLGAEPWPSAVLLNGGTFHAAPFAERLLEVVARGRGGPVLRLEQAEPDLSVARGAVAYARALRGEGPKIASGSAFAYYLALDERQVVCLLPRGAREGQPHALREHVFALTLGRPARFQLYAADAGADAAGLLRARDAAWTLLPPLVAQLPASPALTEARVRLSAELDALGMLELRCVELDDGGGEARQHRLGFALREDAASLEAQLVLPAEGQRQRPASALRAPEPLLEQARQALVTVFGKGRRDVSPRAVKDLLRELEKLLGERAQWGLGTCRALFDALLPLAPGRRRSADHERAFWLLLGYCGRPGLGHPDDERRLRGAAPLLLEPLAFPAEARGWEQLWIAVRRLAPGLPEASQQALRQRFDPFLRPASERGALPKGIKPLGLDEALQAMSWLERVGQRQRIDLGRWILEKTYTSRDPRLWSALARLGTRVPVSAGAEAVLPPQVVERWLDELLRERWSEVPTAAAAAARLAQRTGDRALDVSDAVRREVVKALERVGAPPPLVRQVLEVVVLDAEERSAALGDDLPLGLRFLDGAAPPEPAP